MHSVQEVTLVGIKMAENQFCVAKQTLIHIIHSLTYP